MNHKEEHRGALHLRDDTEPTFAPEETLERTMLKAERSDPPVGNWYRDNPVNGSVACGGGNKREAISRA